MEKCAIRMMPDPSSPNIHVLCIVESRGREYFVSWAGSPTIEQVAEAWKKSRRDFQSYYGVR